jgi:lipopolysaccharide export system permease protein
MGSIGRYIFRTASGAFVLVLVSLTLAIWLTQALRDLDLMTTQGQTLLVFVGITALIIPLLVLVIAPLALVIAVSHVLNKLATDSEIIVMNSAGMQPWRLFRPLVLLTIIVTLGLVAVSAYFAPKGLRMLREQLIAIRADLITNIVQPGRFTRIDRGLVFHIRERRPNGLLVGIVLDDRRDEQERVTVLAEQGDILKNEHGSFLILENGSIHRQDRKQRNPSIVRFDRYAFDMSKFANVSMEIRYSVRERYLWQLIWPDPGDQLYRDEPAQFMAELHDRIVSFLYPITFVVLAFAFLGSPRTTRQSPVWSVLAVTLGVAAVRLTGFVVTIVAMRFPVVAGLQYLLLAATLGAGLYAISRAMIIEPPMMLSQAVDMVSEWFQRRAGVVVEAHQ